MKMQLFNIYSIYDEKSLSFNTPFVAITDGVAMRLFADLVADPRSSVNLHPEDYSLYCIGSFDDSTGAVSPHLPVKFVSRALDFMQCRGAAVGGDTPLKTQSDQPDNIEESEVE